MDNFIEFYKKMYLIRKSEDVIIEYYSEDEMKTPMHMSKGSEAISVGVCSAINDEDQVFGTYRSHAPYLAKTGDLNGFFSEMYGKKTGACEGKSGSMHLCNIDKGYVSSSAIVASNIPVAVGAAFANKMKGNGKKVVVFFGDGAMDEGIFWESINMVSLWSLPILFVCEDNRLAVHTSSKFRQGYEEIIRVIDNFNIATEFCSGLDVEDVYSTTRNVLTLMDNFDEPGFMQIEYYRYLEHVGVNSDTNEKYRINDWCDNLFHDPVELLRKKLKHAGVDVDSIEKGIGEDIYDALKYAKSSDFAPNCDLYKDVYYE